ncbi:hypothetical protein GLOIN_2v1878847 [Rhizophagus clarus]|uniref:Uncharacterized protein n=1 Tax=Rhizophagus clarus TaxID=94130 RepID=A0A8H3LCR3_9GLOM|nr:hypothetical protein GLOIN_2v1878847 [Rhizophagus clarus]
MYVDPSKDYEYGQLSCSEPLIVTNEHEHHSIFSQPVSSNVIGPSINVNEDGQNVLNVPQACIYNYILPAADSSDYQNFLRCNHFIMFRRCVQKALPRSDTKNCSKIAQISWESADKEFKEFFKKYTERVLNSRKKMVFKIVTNKRKSKKKV